MLISKFMINFGESGIAPAVYPYNVMLFVFVSCKVARIGSCQTVCVALPSFRRYM